MNELKRHRCFKIPKSKLDLFLVALYVNFSDSTYCEHKAEWIFPAKEKNFYDVVVGQFGSYPFLETQLEMFVGKL